MSDLLRAWVPTEEDPFDLRQAGHLARRAGFGIPLAEREDWVAAGVEAAVDRVQRCATDVRDPDAMHKRVVSSGEFDKLRSYRVWRALRAGDQLRERMSLVWHDHFAVSNRKIANPRAMTEHLALFDRHGLGRFDDLVLALCKDAAMLEWLDNDVSVAGAPNENFARELFELFTLGRGNYTEHDVREAARAFTGWHVRNGRFFFDRRKHDRGVKELFGERGNFGGEDVIALTLARPESERFVARRLLTTFVHPEPTPAEIDAVAAVWRAHDREIAATVRTILRSQLFFSARAWRSRIKSPIDLVVGTVRTLDLRASPERLARAAATMGMDIGNPPNVAGWPGERAWLNAATWLLRANFAAELGTRFEVEPRLDRALDPDEPFAEAVRCLTDGVLSDTSRAALERARAALSEETRDRAAAAVHAVLALPEAQLL